MKSYSVDRFLSEPQEPESPYQAVMATVGSDQIELAEFKALADKMAMEILGAVIEQMHLDGAIEPSEECHVGMGF